MIPNCAGCECELQEAYMYQELGFDVGLEGMGKREHCLFFVLKNGKFVVPIYSQSEGGE